MGTTYAYAADIVKFERDAAGDLIVFGKAAGPDLDLDGQICDPAWLRKAMPEWMEWGNVREMHQPVAAGIGVELEGDGDDWYLKSKCVDPGTKAKIEAGVLKGYSVGINSPRVVKDAAAPGGRIVGGIVVETSYVDRPCNPTAKMSICKAATAGTAMLPVEAPVEVKAKASAADVAKLLAQVAELAPHAALDLTKAAPAQDIADAKAAIAAIAQLIISEAQGLAGDECEAEHIACLLRAVRSLRWFIAGEQAEAANAVLAAVVAGTGADDAIAGDTFGEEIILTVDLAATAETTKGSTVSEKATPAAADTTVPATTTTSPASAPAAPAAASTTAPQRVSATDLTDMVKTAVAEATKPLKEDLGVLKADLAKALAAPAPGGPVLTRTTAQASAAQVADAQLRAQVDELKAKAAATTDTELRKGYTDRANELLAKAAT